MLRPLFDLSLTLTTVLAVLLNQLFRVPEKKGPKEAPKAETEITKT
jgi:xanthine/uracil permease